MYLRPFSKLTTLAAVLGHVLVASSALGDKPRLVVVPFTAGDGATEASAGRFSSLVIDELKARAEYDLVAPPLATRPVEKTPTAGKRLPSPEAVAAVEAGKRAFDELRFDDASPLLKKGIDGLLADPATADFEVVFDAYLKLAAGSFRQGEEKDAKTALAELCRLAPNFELSAGFPPVFQREFEKAKKRVEKLPRVALSIDGPSGATAFIDGRDLGMVPIIDELVPAGVHFVKLEGNKPSEVYGEQVDVKAATKVKGSFASAPVNVAKAEPAVAENPKVVASFDEATLRRLTAYAKTVNADYALVGYVYKTSDTQLTVGAALFSAKKTAVSALGAQSFDTDVMTANTEAFKLAEELSKRVGSFNTSSLPISFISKARAAVVAKAEPRINPDEVDPAAPKATVVVRPSRGKVETKPEPKPDAPTAKADEVTRAFENPSVVEPDAVAAAKTGAEKPEVKSGVPAWVWVVTGIAVAAGVGVGGYFGYTELTKPVTGTVNATW